MSMSIGQKVMYKGEEYTILSKGFNGMYRLVQVLAESPSSYLIGKDVPAVYADECTPIDILCEFCSDPILEGKGRQYRGGKYYHDDEESNCFLESVKDLARKPEVILKAAESMTFDKRVVA